MYTLFIDTHYKDILIIIFKDNELLDRIVINDVKSTSIETMPAVEKIISKNNLKINDINKIAVVKGPGSFTSVRLGITIAKTLAFSLNIPIVTLTSIDLIGLNLDKSSYVGVKENNGTFVSFYEPGKNNEINYMKKALYEEFKENNKVIEEKDINYNKLISFINKLNYENYHNVNPLYIKTIEALNDKRN